MKKGDKKEAGLSAQNGPVFKEQREDRANSCNGSFSAKDLNLCITPKNRNAMNKKSKTVQQPLAKKVFIVGKVYDTGSLTEKEIETCVQADLDAWIGKDKVIFNIGVTNNRINLIFRRNVDYGTAKTKTEILDADAYMVCGIGSNKFQLPVMWFEPILNYPYHFEQSVFKKCYKASALKLGADKVKWSKLEIGNHSLILRLK